MEISALDRVRGRVAEDRDRQDPALQAARRGREPCSSRSTASRSRRRGGGRRPEVAPTLVLLHEGLGCVGAVARLSGGARARRPAAACSPIRGRAMASPTRSRCRGRSPTCMTRPAPLPRVLDAAGIGRAILVGHSDGASIAAIARRQPATIARVRGLVLIAPHFFVEDVSDRRHRGGASGLSTTGDLRAALAPLSPRRRQRVPGWNGAWLDPASAPWRIDEFLPYIRVPMLLVQGEHDPYGTRGAARASPKSWPMGRWRRVLVPGARHAPHLESRRRRCWTAVAGFAHRLLAVHEDLHYNAGPPYRHCSMMHKRSREASACSRIDFQTDPSRYRHWRLEFDGPVASLIMDVDPAAGCSRAMS